MTLRSLEERGAPIPGSRYVRDFCWVCGDPIRVLPEHLCTRSGKRERNCCDRCGYLRPQPPPRPVTCVEEPSPAWENAIRAMEDGNN